MMTTISNQPEEMGSRLSRKSRLPGGEINVPVVTMVSYMDFPASAPSDKRQPELTPECQEAIDAVLEMEDLFSKLSFNVDSVALKRPNEGKTDRTAELFRDSGVAQNCLMSLHNSWRYVQSLSLCTQVHMENAAEYHQFWHTVNECDEWLEYHMDNLPELFKTHTLKYGTTYEVKQTISTIMDTLKEFLQCQTRLDVLYEKSKIIYPIDLRRQPLPYEMNVQILVDYTVDQVKLNQGDTVVLTDNTDDKKWKIRTTESSEDHELEIPSLLAVIPPISSQAIDAAVRLRNQMLALWSAASRCLSQHVTKLLSLVFSKVSQQNGVYGTPNETQLKDLCSLFDEIKEKLGTSMEGTTSYTQLSGQCETILGSLSKTADSQSRGLLIQVTILRRLMQRYWDFCIYHHSYRDYLDQTQSPRQIFICTQDTEFKYITAAHYVRYMDIDLDKMKNGLYEEIEETTIMSEESQVTALAPDADKEPNNNINGEEEEEEYVFEESEVIQSEEAVETTVVITGVVKQPGTQQEEIISLQDAIDSGLLDFSRGVYKLGADEIPIHQAMSEGHIKTSIK